MKTYPYKHLYENFHGKIIHNDQITENHSTFYQMVKREVNCGLRHAMEIYSAIKKDNMVEFQKYKCVLSRMRQS